MAAVNNTRRAGKSLQQNQEARVRLCSRVGSTPCCPSLTGPGWPSASARECVSSSPGSRGPSPIGPRSAYVQAEQTAACEAEIYFPYVSPPRPPHSFLTAKTWENKLGHPASWERYSDLPHVVFQN